MCSRWLVCVFLLGLFFNAFASIVINQLSGTDTALFGANNSLTCEYEIRNETGVVVKWFYNLDTQIVSWILDKKKPQAMGTFKDVLNFEESDLQNSTKYSTIYFKDLTFNLTGKYTCKVTGDEDEGFETKTMVVYQPASLLEFVTGSKENSFDCTAFDLYPQPKIIIVGKYIERNEIVPYKIGYLNLNKSADGFYNISQTVSYDMGALNDSVTFTCIISIPETSYSETITVNVYVERNESTTEFPDYYDSTTISTVSPIRRTLFNSAATKATTTANFAEIFGPSKWLISLAAVIVTYWKNWKA